MKTGKKIWRYISSMQFAILLLVILAAACSAGSFITQGQSYEWYASRYSERTAALIMALHLDDAFHSWWFALITVFLCINLLLCNVLRFPQLLRRSRREAGERSLEGGITVQGVGDPGHIFAKMHMPKPVGEVTGDGREIMFARKNSVGFWGAWVCHAGILLLILGFSLGQMTKKEYTVYGLPGQVRTIGDTGLALAINDFTVDLQDDDTVRQYTADITVFPEDKDAGSAGKQAQISVNHPASLYGLKFYQNSTGWAARVHIAKDGEPLQEAEICAGEYVPVQDKPELVIYLNAFYPDYVRGEDGMPQTASGKILNPAYLYTVYYQGQILGMNALMQEEELTIDEYTVTFSDPRNYTLIQIKKDSFTWLALAGGLLTTIGLLMAFYLLPSAVCAVKEEDGSWRVQGKSRKGGAIFRERFLQAAGEAGGYQVNEAGGSPAEEGKSL